MKFLMGFRANKVKKLDKTVAKKANSTPKVGQTPKPPQASTPIIKKPTSSPNLNLNKEEVELLLFCIKHSTFQGTSIELVYNLVSKLQKQLPKVNK